MTPTIAVAILAALLSLSAQPTRATSAFPCHSMRSQLGTNVTCGFVVIPPRLCSACQIKPPLPNGDFANCQSIYDINDACQAELREYVNHNSCDPLRKQQLLRFSDHDREALDYFVYALCENCCDCIPQGAREDDYERLLAADALYTPTRGNCPAHAFYDICNIWPQVRHFRHPGYAPKPRPRACPLLQEWIASPAANDWINAAETAVDWRLRRFLNNLNHVTKCRMETFWKSCVRLEQTQSRI